MSGPSWDHFTNFLLRIPGTRCGGYHQTSRLYSGTCPQRSSRTPLLMRSKVYYSRMHTKGRCTGELDANGSGGWYPARNSKGELDPWCSDWFSLEISKEDFPWIFEKGDKPSLVISTLEALAILISLKLRFGDAPDPMTRKSS